MCLTFDFFSVVVVSNSLLGITAPAPPTCMYILTSLVRLCYRRNGMESEDFQQSRNWVLISIPRFIFTRKNKKRWWLSVVSNFSLLLFWYYCFCSIKMKLNLFSRWINFFFFLERISRMVTRKSLPCLDRRREKFLFNR